LYPKRGVVKMETGLTAAPSQVNLDTLRANFRGELLRPKDEAYDAARKIWNGSIDKHPGLIARCTGTADILAAVRFAREHGLLVAVRSGGHNVAGNAVCDGGMVIDLSRMKGIRVDPATRTAHVQAGLTWGDFDHETQAFGLATPSGVMSTTGVAGFTLGGGIGWLMRKHGLACDNLLSADIVTADGRMVCASPRENEDLFWGIRGGGGNFGIATSLEFRLHAVGPVVLAGLLFHPMTAARELLRFNREFAAAAPDELTTITILRKAPPAPFLPTEVHGAPVIAIGLCYAGPIEDGERAVRPLRAFRRPLVDAVRPMPFVAFQRISDGSWAPGFQNYWKSAYLDGLSDDAVETIVSYAERITSPLSDIKIAHQQGAISVVGEDATAFSHRSAPFNLNINTRWTDPAESENHIAWTRGLFDAMRPFSTGGVYVNFLGNEGEERVIAAYGKEKYERLVTIKNKYDPMNFFQLNQNIKPSSLA
jgi:FAD/FMN-containing dehydrogenase